MALPSFTAECSLHRRNHYVGMNKDISKTDRVIMPQFNGFDCSEFCRDSCCVCPHDSEGVIESSCFCNQQCIYDCVNITCNGFSR